MPVLPEPSVAERADLWRTAPALLQQARRCHLEACGGRRAKRALFGQPDREETRRFVKEELAAIRAADQQKYNFDFSAMRPLEGPFEWQPVAVGEVSAAYQLGRLQSGLVQHRSARRLDFDAPRAATPPEASRCDSTTGAGRHVADPAGPVGADSPQAAAPSRSDSAAAERRRPEADPSTPAPSLTEALARRGSPPLPAAASRQTSITDFLKSRKRSSVSSSGDSAAKRPSVLPTLATGGGAPQPSAAAAADGGAQRST